ncbi:MAG: hypothetical protein JSR45_15365 [Proteobacteria bacterium]|nr:hypothetical protein [Pseudomonadota bacterium]
MDIGAAAFSGFGLIARRPLSVLVWGLVYTLIVMIPMGLFFGLAGPDIVEFYRTFFQNAAHGSSAPPDMGPMMAMQARLGMINPLLWIASLTARGVLMAAVFRAILRPEQSSFFSLRLGMDELWQAIMYLVMSFVAVGVIIGVLIVSFIVGGGLFLAASAAPEPWTGWVRTLAIIICVVGGVGAMLWVLLRLSMAAPMTFAHKQFMLGESWSLTRGRTLQLFLMCLLLIVVLMVVEAVIGTIVVVAVMSAAGAGGLFQPGHLRAMLDQPASVWMSGLLPWFIGLGAVGALLTGPLAAIFIAPWATAYKQIADRRAASLPV